MFLYRSAWIRYFHFRQLFGCIEYQFLVVLIHKHRAELFVFLHVDGAIALVARQHAYTA